MDLERGCVAALGTDNATCTEIDEVRKQVQISQGLDVGTQVGVVCVCVCVCVCVFVLVYIHMSTCVFMH